MRPTVGASGNGAQTAAVPLPSFHARSTSSPAKPFYNDRPQANARRELEQLRDVREVLVGSRGKGQAKAVPATVRSVCQTEGAEWALWKKSMQKELTSLTSTGTHTPRTISLLPPGTRMAPAKCVLAVKPDPQPNDRTLVKRKSRITICGNVLPQARESSTRNLDANVMCTMISWAVQMCCQVASVDVSTAFLNADLPPSRAVIMAPPKIFVQFGLVDQGERWQLVKALYGLKESPALWGDTRDKDLAVLEIPMSGGPSPHRRPQSNGAHGGNRKKTPKHYRRRCRCNFRRRCRRRLGSLTLGLQAHPFSYSPKRLAYRRQGRRLGRCNTSGHASSTSPAWRRFLPTQVFGAILVYVDEFTVLAPPPVRKAFLAALRGHWTTSEPQVLGENDVDRLTFLGITIELTEDEQLKMGPDFCPSEVILHQAEYIEEMLDRFADGPLRSRTSPGEQEVKLDSHDGRVARRNGAPSPNGRDEPVKPADDLERHRVFQQVCGAALWCSTRGKTGYLLGSLTACDCYGH